ncbi:Transglutaminase-like superfamily protein [Pseudoxanthomonas sp. GM95]|uniref:lasso peptide biosynthesis B2 protein n=1 Tax=Pseudoxanthomonas sp. GM95 TaxID=1881043 RepID=UPI0008BAB77F|nr:lasso peptide biosynthesis B2 protein [Pseudoxanthomonas sp. GM95]SEM51621.1 Transglutaminase-like superfamily protein [Pseudoxanthomonas sp. GM95]
MRLNEDVSFCELDGQLFFMDIERDRYFKLSQTLELEFRHYLRFPHAPNADLDALCRRGLLVADDQPRTGPPPGQVQVAERSALELEPPPCRGSLPPRQVVLAVLLSHWQLSMWSLKRTLLSLAAYRSRRTARRLGEPSEQRLLAAAQTFRRIRPSVPLPTRCLVDSIAMVRFLADQGLYADLVMGVACDPFSAHAWVQQQELVLNESLGTVLAHVPIRVV